MKKIWLAVFALAVFGVGCGPRLAQSPYGQKELEWKGFVEQAYPSWTPPQTIPPVRSQDRDRPDVIIEDEKIEIVTPESPEPVAVVERETVKMVPQEQFYTVQKNDSLWKIAVKFYKDGSKWPLIKDANKDIITNPKKLPVGKQLRIPMP